MCGSGQLLFPALLQPFALPGLCSPALLVLLEPLQAPPGWVRAISTSSTMEKVERFSFGMGKEGEQGGVIWAETEDDAVTNP